MQTKEFPVINEENELIGYRIGYIDHGETEAKQFAAVAAWSLTNPRPLEPADDFDAAITAAYKAALTAWSAAAQKVGDAVEPVYGVPAGCIDVPAPKHSEVDVLKFSAGVWTLLAGEKLKRETAAEDAKAAERAAEAAAVKAAEAQAADAQAARYADGLKAGFSAAQVSFIMNGYKRT
jgi:hypothetical protein